MPMLERVRRRLRDLVKLIEKRAAQALYTDFEDQMGAEVEIDLPGLDAGTDFEGSAPRPARSSASTRTTSRSTSCE